MSTFHGLEMAKRALFSQQMGLYTTGHNISNINTDGYSRQRVNFEAESGYPRVSRTSPHMAGQMGTGVKVGTVQRIRDQFLDMQYRTQNSGTSYWGTKATALSRMESLMNEMNESDGMSKVLDDFWQSLSDLSGASDNTGTRKVVAEKALALTETFQHLSKSLETIRQDLKYQIGVEDGSSSTLGDINSLLRSINDLNKQIQEIEPHGLLPNDLYDRRDFLIDELSSMVDIKVSYERSDGGALQIADGIAKIELVNAQGNPLDPPGALLGKGIEPQSFSIEFDQRDGFKGAVSAVRYGNEQVSFLDVNGSLKGLIESYGYIDNAGEVVGNYPEMLANLDKMAQAFAESFNEIHRQGFDLNGNSPTIDFFVIGNNGAATITVNNLIMKDASLIAASQNGDAGDGRHASKLGDVIIKSLESDALGPNTSVKGFYDGIIGELAVTTKESIRRTENNVIQRNKAEQDRQSISSVSLDEEVANLLKFQHAYNAAARSLTAADELLDKIINGMGIVGR